MTSNPSLQKESKSSSAPKGSTNSSGGGGGLLSIQNTFSSLSEEASARDPANNRNEYKWPSNSNRNNISDLFSKEARRRSTGGQQEHQSTSGTSSQHTGTGMSMSTNTGMSVNTGTSLSKHDFFEAAKMRFAGESTSTVTAKQGSGMARNQPLLKPRNRNTTPTAATAVTAAAAATSDTPATVATPDHTSNANINGNANASVRGTPETSELSDWNQESLNNTTSTASGGSASASASASSKSAPDNTSKSNPNYSPNANETGWKNKEEMLGALDHLQDRVQKQQQQQQQQEELKQQQELKPQKELMQQQGQQEGHAPPPLMQIQSQNRNSFILGNITQNSSTENTAKSTANTNTNTDTKPPLSPPKSVKRNSAEIAAAWLYSMEGSGSSGTDNDDDDSTAVDTDAEPQTNSRTTNEMEQEKEQSSSQRKSLSSQQAGTTKAATTDEAANLNGSKNVSSDHSQGQGSNKVTVTNDNVTRNNNINNLNGTGISISNSDSVKPILLPSTDYQSPIIKQEASSHMASYRLRLAEQYVKDKDKDNSSLLENSNSSYGTLSTATPEDEANNNNDSDNDNDKGDDNQVQQQQQAVPGVTPDALTENTAHSTSTSTSMSSTTKKVESWYADYGGKGVVKSVPSKQLSTSSMPDNKSTPPLPPGAAAYRSLSARSVSTYDSNANTSSNKDSSNRRENARQRQLENMEMQALVTGDLDVSKYSHYDDDDDDDSYDPNAVETNPDYANPVGLPSATEKLRGTGAARSASNDSDAEHDGKGVHHERTNSKQEQPELLHLQPTTDTAQDDALSDLDNYNANNSVGESGRLDQEWDEENPQQLQAPLQDESAGDASSRREANRAKDVRKNAVERSEEERRHRTQAIHFVLGCCVIVAACSIMVGIFIAFVGVDNDDGGESNDNNTQQILTTVPEQSQTPTPSFNPYWATQAPVTPDALPEDTPTVTPQPSINSYWNLGTPTPASSTPTEPASTATSISPSGPIAQAAEAATLAPVNSYWETKPNDEAATQAPGNSYWEILPTEATAEVAAAEDTASPAPSANAYWSLMSRPPVRTATPTAKPTLGPTAGPAPEPNPTASNVLPGGEEEFIVLSELSEETWQTIASNPASPQAEAFRWLLDDPNLEEYSQFRQEQRFALATFYFALFNEEAEVAISKAPPRRERDQHLRGRRELQSLIKTSWLDYGSDECNWFYTSGDDTSDSFYISFSSSSTTKTYSACNENGAYDTLVVPVKVGSSPGTITDIYMESLPPEIAMLSELRIMHLPNNKVPNTLSGFFPEEMKQLIKLQELNMSQSNIMNWNSQAIARLPSSLEVLDLSYNGMKGPIMVELPFLLSSLRKLILIGNEVSGTIPESIPSWTRLDELHLTDNRLSGELPSQLGFLSNHLEVLSVSANLLEGSLPSEIGSLRMLKMLDLEANAFYSNIPSALANMGSLEDIRLANNNFISSIPDISQLDRLTSLQLHSNSLTGFLPELPRSLEVLDLHDNFLMGTIDTRIGNLQSLESLFLDENALSGELPSEIGLLRNVTYIGLESNNLAGRIPPELGTLEKLRYLQLSGNSFSSTIPVELGGLTSLKYLFLASNELEGTIPSELGLLTELRYLDLGGRNSYLTGSVPPELCALTSLSIRVRCSRIQCDCGCLC